MGLKQRIEDNAAVFFLGAVIGSFAAGFGAYHWIVRASGSELASPATLAEHDMLLAKDRFLSLYLRLALMHMPPNDIKHTDKERRQALEYLDEYLLAEIEKQEGFSVGKGQNSQAVVRLPDGTFWDLPQDSRAVPAD